MAWTFERSNTTVDVWRLLVFKSGHVAGRIFHGPDGVYRFCTGGGAAGTSLLQQPYLQDRDLEKLKAAIKGISPSN